PRASRSWFASRGAGRGSSASRSGPWPSCPCWVARPEGFLLRFPGGSNDDGGFMRRLAVVTLVVLAANALPRAAQAQTPVPRALEDWQAWVLKGREFHRCPFLAGSNPAVAESYRCAWPERLLLNLDAHGGRFSQRWQVYTESWVALPGDLVRWPEEVLVDGRSAALVAHEGVPQVRLTAGAHQLSGAFAWQVRPESLTIPLQTALLDLVVDGRQVARPQRDGASLALGRQSSAADARQAQPATALSPPRSGPAPDEVWSFAANDRLRVAAVEGVAGIDPLQANVPGEWRGHPAFRMQPGSQLKIVERSRGLANMDQNRLRLSRRLWLDFDHEGFTAVDNLSGTLRRDWRLAMREPY